MQENTPVLHIICGKIAAGKSTLAARLAKAPGHVLVVEDDWLAALYAEEMTTPRDFMRCSAKLRAIMGPHVTQLLNTGVSVVLDFQANTRAARAWMRTVLDGSDAAHQLHVLAPSDAVCLARLRARNAAGTHPFEVSEAQYYAVTKHFVAPSEDEGFTIVHHA